MPDSEISNRLGLCAAKKFWVPVFSSGLESPSVYDNNDAFLFKAFILSSSTPVSSCVPLLPLRVRSRVLLVSLCGPPSSQYETAPLTHREKTDHK